MREINKEIIMADSNEAAEYKIISGWVSRHGRFYGTDESTARYDGCTHRPCQDCGEPAEKCWLLCPKCRAVKEEARYNAIPKEVWDEVGGLYSEVADKYFWSWDEVKEYCDEEDIPIEKLHLIICKPVYLSTLDVDYFKDALPEDGELPDEVIKAIESFNKVIKDSEPISWRPASKAVKLEVSNA